MTGGATWVGSTCQVVQHVAFLLVMQLVSFLSGRSSAFLSRCKSMGIRVIAEAYGLRP